MADLVSMVIMKLRLTSLRKKGGGIFGGEKISFLLADELEMAQAIKVETLLLEKGRQRSQFATRAGGLYEQILDLERKQDGLTGWSNLTHCAHLIDLLEKLDAEWRFQSS